MIIFVKFRHAQCPGRFLATHELRVGVDVELLEKQHTRDGCVSHPEHCRSVFVYDLDLTIDRKLGREAARICGVV